MFNANKNRHEEINRFRNGHLTQCPTSVDIEKLVRVGSVISKLFEGFICDNLEFTPFEKFVIKMTEKINKNKKEKKDLLQTSTKSKTNAGFCLRAEINDSFKCVTTQWMKIEYNDRGEECFPLKNGNIRVKLQDHDGVDDNGYSKKTKSQPCF